MKRPAKSNRRLRWWLHLGLVPIGWMSAGCCCPGGGLGSKCEDIPKGAIPPPLGTHLNEIDNAQVERARADAFVIYRHEWSQGGKELGPYGYQHINKIIRKLPTVSYPVIIEPEPDNALNESRRQLIITYLVQGGVGDAERLVILGFPEAEGLYGEEAPRIFRQMLTPSNRNLGGTGFGRNNSGQGFNGGGFGGFSGFQNSGF